MLWQRFIILAVLGILLVGPSLYLYLDNSNEVVDFSIRERQGLPVGSSTTLLLQQIQQHRGLSAAFLGAGQLAEQRLAKQMEIDKTLSLLEAQLSKGSPEIKAQLQKARSDWIALRDGIAAHSVDVSHSYQSHTALCLYLLTVIEQVADEFGLALDPGADTYYLMRIVYFDVPALAENLGELRAKGAGQLATKDADTNAKALMFGLVSTANDGLARLERTFKKATAANPRLTTPLGPSLEAGAGLADDLREIQRGQPGNGIDPGDARVGDHHRGGVTIARAVRSGRRRELEVESPRLVAALRQRAPGYVGGGNAPHQVAVQAPERGAAKAPIAHVQSVRRYEHPRGILDVAGPAERGGAVSCEIQQGDGHVERGDHRPPVAPQPRGAGSLGERCCNRVGRRCELDYRGRPRALAATAER